MKKTLNHPTTIKLLTMLLILAVLILWVTRGSQAQNLEQSEDNTPRQVTQSNQVTADVSQSGEDNTPQQGTQPDQAVAHLGTGQAEDNIPGEKSAGVPDLVITDPGADVMAQIESLTGVAAAYSLAIPGAAFIVDGSSGRQWFFGFNSAYLYPSGAGNYCGIAPVYLPNGATVTAFTSYVLDNDATYNANVYLYAKPLGSTASSTTMADVATTAQNANLQALVDATILQPAIDNANYTYHIGVCLWGVDSTMRFYASQILYSK